MKINVRSISSDERDVVEQLYKDYLNELHPERSQLPLEWISNVYNQALVQQRYLWLAFVQEEIIGFVDFKIMPCFPGSDQKYALIFDFYIMPSHRRCGYGSQLASLILEEIHQQKVGSVELNVLPGNQNAMAFWQSLGFNLRHHTLEMLVTDN